MLICFWLSQELPEILLPTHNSSDFMSNIRAVLCVSTDRSSAHFYCSHLVKKAQKYNSQTFFLAQINVEISWRKWETRLSPWSFALRWSLLEILVRVSHRAASQVLKSKQAWPFPFLPCCCSGKHFSQPASPGETWTRWQVDLGAKVKTPHYTLIIIISSFAGASLSTGYLSHPKMHRAHWRASAMESDAVSAVLTTNFLLFATLWRVQLGVSSPVTGAGSADGGGECGHWAVRLRACSRSGDLWETGCSPVWEGWWHSGVFCDCSICYEW